MRDVDDKLSDNRRRKRRKKFLILLGTLLLFSVLLLRVWFSSKAVELAYEIDRLAAQKEALEEENRKLSLEIARLESPERISRIATTDLKMIRSSNAEVIMLEK
jgi:cell division protein FtsL